MELQAKTVDIDAKLWGRLGGFKDSRTNCGLMQTPWISVKNCKGIFRAHTKESTRDHPARFPLLCFVLLISCNNGPLASTSCLFSLHQGFPFLTFLAPPPTHPPPPPSSHQHPTLFRVILAEREKRLASGRPSHHPVVSIASAGNRTLVTSMATMYSTTKPLMPCEPMIYEIQFLLFGGWGPSLAPQLDSNPALSADRWPQNAVPCQCVNKPAVSLMR